MGNFDFKAFVAQQKIEDRREREDRIIKESHKKILLAERFKRTTRGTEMELMIETIVLDWASDKDILEEGILSKMKYFGAKTLGTWEKGGGIWGRGERQEKAKAQYEKMLEKTAGGILKKFMAQIEKSYPEFPNMESEENFGEALADVYTFYDSIKHAALTPKDVEGKPISAVQSAIDGGKIDVMMANQIIVDLRKMLHKILSYDLADVYKHFDENKKPKGDEEVLDEIFGFGKKKGWEAEAERQDAEDRGEKPDDVLSGEQDQTETEKSLKSNLLPALLALGGSAGILMKILVNAGWFSSLFNQLVQSPTPQAAKQFGETIFTNITPQPGEGISQTIGRMAFGDPNHFGPDARFGDLVRAMKSLGIQPANPEALAELSGDASGFLGDWSSAWGTYASDAANATVGDVFPNGGLGATGKLGFKLGKSAVTAITREISKEIGKGAAKASGVTAVAGTLGISAPVAASILGVIGVTGIAAAAGVKALRLKGQHSSRAEKLITLRKAMKDLNSPIKLTKDEEEPKTGNPPTEEEPKTGNPPADDPLSDIGVGDFVIVKNKKGQEILTKVSEMPQNLQEKNQWEDEGNVFITGGDWSIPLGGRRGYSSKGQKWIAVKDGEVQIRKAEAEDFTRAVETDSKVATKMGVDKMDHEAEFEDEESQNVEYSKFQERLANDQRIWGDDSEPTISPEEMTTIFKAIKDYAGGKGHFQRFIMHGTDQGAGAKVDGDFLPDTSRTADSLDEAKVQDLELKGVVNLLAKSIVPKLETNVPKKLVMGAVIDSLIKAKMLITHKGKRLKKSPKFKSRMKPTKYNPDMDVPKGEMGKGPAPRAVPKELEEIFKRINQRLRKANKKQITVPQLLEYLKSRKKKLLK